MSEVERIFMADLDDPSKGLPRGVVPGGEEDLVASRRRVGEWTISSRSKGTVGHIVRHVQGRAVWFAGFLADEPDAPAWVSDDVEHVLFRLVNPTRLRQVFRD